MNVKNNEPIQTAVINGKRVYHIKAAAKMAGVNPRTIYRHIQAGTIKAAKYGNSWYLTAAEARKVGRNHGE